MGLYLTQYILDLLRPLACSVQGVEMIRYVSPFTQYGTGETPIAPNSPQKVIVGECFSGCGTLRTGGTYRTLR